MTPAIRASLVVEVDRVLSDRSARTGYADSREATDVAMMNQPS